MPPVAALFLGFDVEVAEGFFVGALGNALVHDVFADLGGGLGFNEELFDGFHGAGDVVGFLALGEPGDGGAARVGGDMFVAEGGDAIDLAVGIDGEVPLVAGHA